MNDETRADDATGTTGRRVRHMRIVRSDPEPLADPETLADCGDPECDDDPDPGGPTLLAW